MKTRIVLTLIVFALVQGTFAQTKEQIISDIDKIVNEMKAEKDSYRKIVIPDSIAISEKAPIQRTQIIYKNGDEIVLYQISDTIIYKNGNKILLDKISDKHNYIIDYYFKDEETIYVETKKENNRLDYGYFKGNKLIAQYYNGEEYPYTGELKIQLGEAMQKEHDWLIEEYKNR